MYLNTHTAQVTEKNPILNKKLELHTTQNLYWKINEKKISITFFVVEIFKDLAWRYIIHPAYERRLNFQENLTFVLWCLLKCPTKHYSSSWIGLDYSFGNVGPKKDALNVKVCRKMV